jgi:TamB, inner membrane protein subunit of TAM complex
MFVKILKILIKTVLYSIVGILLLSVLGIILLRMPDVQTRLAQYYAPKISKMLGYPVEIDKVTVRFFDEATLEGVRIKDYQGFQMIDVEKLDVDFQLKSLFQDSLQTKLDYVRLYHPKVELVTDKNGDLNIDEFIRRIDKLTAPKTPRTTAPTPFKIGEADIVDGIFSMNDEAEPYMKDKKSFDHYHFTFHEFNAHLNDFTLIRDTVSFSANIRGYDKSSDLRIKTLRTKFLLSDTQMRFDNLFLKFNNTTVRDQMLMTFKSQKDFKHWNSLVRMKATFDSSVVASQDIAKFVNAMYDYKDIYYLNGKFDGTVNDFKLTNFDLYFGKKSKLRGDFAFKGLPSIPKTLMDLKMRKSYVQVSELERYIGKDAIAKIEKFGHIMFDGTFKGTTSNFKTTGVLDSDLGHTDVDVAMVLKPNSANSTYQGKIRVENFKLGKLIENAGSLGDLTLSGNIIGKGFSVKNATLSFDGSVKQLTYNQYSYKNIYIDGKLSKELFDGRVALKDTNIIFDLDGKVDLREGREFFDLHGKVSKANLKPLHFSEQDWRFQTIVDAQFSGKKIDDIVGQGRLRNTYINLEKKNLVIDSLLITSSNTNDYRKINIESDLANLNFVGDFKPSTVAKDLPQLVEEYKLYFVGDEISRNNYYATKNFTPSQSYKIDYQLNLKHIDPILALFYPDGHVSKKTLVDGTFGVGNTSTFNLNSKIDTLMLGDYKFYKSDIELNSSKFYNTAEVLAAVIINSKNQKLNVLAPTENLDLEASWDQDRISFTSGLKQVGTTNRANLNGTLRFIQDGLELQFKRSKFRLLEQDWNINPNNLLTIAGNGLTSKDFTIANLDQLISADGIISSDSTHTMNFKAKDFKIETLSPLIALNIKGIVNGDIDLSNAYRSVNLNSKLTVNDLTFDETLIGNLSGEARYDQDKKILNLDYNIERLNNNILTLQGTYDPRKKDNSLDMVANLNKSSLQILESFTKDIFSKLDGTASGKLKINGTLGHPLLVGEIDIKKGHATFDYLNTSLNFEDKISFEPDEIRTKNLHITDDEGNKATLRGGVFYDGESSFNVSLNTDLQKFKIMNTLPKDNDLYYGTGYATGKLSLTGSFDNLKVSTDLRTERGTKLYIPLDRAAEAGGKDDIEFVSVVMRQDSLAKVQTKTAKKAASSSNGIKLDLNFDLTPDAYGEVQFDKQTGDIMKANGSGRINMKIDTKGDFAMTGGYQIERGDYTFTFLNIVNKKFNIQRGSSINWSGNPYDAVLDIKAIYTQNLSYLGSVIDTNSTGQQYKNQAEYTRGYPVDVIFNLKNSLLNPTISYDVKLRDYPQVGKFNTDVTAFENRLKTDDQSLSNQVTSILLLGQMISQTNSTAYGANNILSNIVEFASNQVSNAFSQIDPNLIVNVTLNPGNSTQSLINVSNLQVGVTYTINDRFRITRSGGFTNAANQANAQSLLGDWALEWLITPDGNMRLKTYNRNVQTSLTQGSTNTQTYTASGVSFVYSKNFNYFFKPKKKPSFMTIPSTALVSKGDGN